MLLKINNLSFNLKLFHNIKEIIEILEKDKNIYLYNIEIPDIKELKFKKNMPLEETIKIITFFKEKYLKNIKYWKNILKNYNYDLNKVMSLKLPDNPEEEFYQQLIKKKIILYEDLTNTKIKVFFTEKLQKYIEKNIIKTKNIKVSCFLYKNYLLDIDLFSINNKSKIVEKYLEVVDFLGIKKLTKKEIRNLEDFFKNNNSEEPSIILAGCKKNKVKLSRKKFNDLYKLLFNKEPNRTKFLEEKNKLAKKFLIDITPEKDKIKVSFN